MKSGITCCCVVLKGVKMKKEAVGSAKTVRFTGGWRKEPHSLRLSPSPRRGLKGGDRCAFPHLQLSAILDVICSRSGENEFVSAKISLMEICCRFNYTDSDVRPNLPITGITAFVQRLCCHFKFGLKVG